MLEIDSLKRPIINSDIEFVIKKKKNLPAKKKKGITEICPLQ